MVESPAIYSRGCDFPKNETSFQKIVQPVKSYDVEQKKHLHQKIFICYSNKQTGGKQTNRKKGCGNLTVYTISSIAGEWSFSMIQDGTYARILF